MKIFTSFQVKPSGFRPAEQRSQGGARFLCLCRRVDVPRSRPWDERVVFPCGESPDPAGLHAFVKPQGFFPQSSL